MNTNPKSNPGRATLCRAVVCLCLLSGFSFQVSSFAANVFGWLEGATNAPAGLPVKFTYAPGMSVYPYYRFQQAITIYTQTNGYFILSNANPGLCYLSPGNGLANIGLNVPNDTNTHNFLDILAVSNSVPALVPSTYYLSTNAISNFVASTNGLAVNLNATSVSSPDEYWSVNSDGSGSLASSSIIWNASGDLTLPGPLFIGTSGSQAVFDTTGDLTLPSGASIAFVNGDFGVTLVGNVTAANYAGAGANIVLATNLHLVITNGLATKATSQYTFAAGGWTNIGTNDVRVWGFTGTNFAFSNATSKVHFSLGTVTNQFYILQPGEALQGTNCTIAGAVDF